IGKGARDRARAHTEACRTSGSANQGEGGIEGRWQHRATQLTISEATVSKQEQTFRVEIYDRVYEVRSPAEERYTKQLAKSVDGVMRSVAEKSHTVDSLRLAVLAALHFADRYERLKERYDKLN